MILDRGVQILDLLPAFLIGLTLVGIRFIPPSHTFDEEYLSIRAGKNLKGIAVLMVLFHHLAQRTEGGVLFQKFCIMGYLPVAIFAFLSGYGLQKSYMHKRNYAKYLLRVRIPLLLTSYLFAMVLYWLLNLYFGRMNSLSDILKGLSHGSPIVPFSWYIEVILVFYIYYWFLIKVKMEPKNMVWGVIIWYALYVGFCLYADWGDWCYVSMHLLVLGVMWATYEEKWLDFIKRHYWVMLFLITAVFSFLLIFKGNIFESTGNVELFTILTMLCALSFILSLIMLAMKVRIGNRILEFLGTISLEVYMYQGMAIMVTSRANRSEILWIVICILASVIVGAVMHSITKMLQRFYIRIEYD